MTTIEYFIDQLNKDLAKFKDFWKSNEDGGAFPKELNPGDWEEQFNLYREGLGRSK